MDRKVQNRVRNIPNYKQIYLDMISKKYPEKVELCQSLFVKDHYSTLDIVKINRILYGSLNNPAMDFNQKLKSYDSNSILEILNYQKKNKLNNSQLAKHFKLSRNTVTKWKKLFDDSVY
ncbi:helix-turn-helix domain-containing protein [Flavobacteriaceae bacterium W22]|nr:helix-turn-helix domain-containing protein [Flavobacteriaceae bacterium W22]